MRNKIVFALLASVFASVAYLGAQCTADKDLTREVRTAMAAAKTAHWPLPIPRNQPIRTLEDFRGALLLAGPNIYQIESIRWRVTPSQDLEVVALDGYTPEGLHVQFDKAATGGRPIESVNDFAGFHFGRPNVDPKVYHVDSIDFSTNAAGVVSISQMSAVDMKTDEPIRYSHPVPTTKVAIDQAEGPCSLQVDVACNSSNCTGGACGGAPACPCNGTSGACSGSSHSVCTGTCPKGRSCNGSVADCRCERDPVVVPPGGVVPVVPKD